MSTGAPGQQLLNVNLGWASPPMSLLSGRLVASSSLLLTPGDSDTAEQGAGCQLGVPAGWDVYWGYSRGSGLGQSRMDGGCWHSGG